VSDRETRWWWVRHAPVPDGGQIYGQRDLDCDCSDAAVFEALARELPPDAVWITSHLARTRQTAAAILEAMRHSPEKGGPRAVVELAEQHLGDWQGLDRKDFFERQGRARHPFWFGPASERAPNGESFHDLIARVGSAIETLSEEFAGRDIVAVTHGGTIRAALVLALRLDPEAALALVIENCSLTRIDRLPGTPATHGWRVGTVNHVPWGRPYAGRRQAHGPVS
jgi:alpha-ribazole phosphatase